jgi:MFS family permease
MGCCKKQKTVSSSSKSTQGIHYGWVILVTGIVVMTACLGIGRFSLGMLLPSMGSSLKLSYAQMGSISTANFVGYMVSVLFAGAISVRIGARLTISLGLALVGTSMIMIWTADTMLRVLLLYILTGVGSGLANVSMMGLVTSWFAKQFRGRAAGSMLIGNGLGIVLAGFLVPFLNFQFEDQGWRMSWLVLGTIALTASLAAGLLLRNDPSHVQLTPMGSTDKNTRNNMLATETNSEAESQINKFCKIQLGCIYLLFGASYAVYVTFIVTVLVNERGFSEQTAGAFWSIVGFLSFFSGPLAGWVSDKIGRPLALLIVFVQLTCAYLLALNGLSDFCIYLSIGLFGLSLWSVPTIMTAAVGDLAGAAKAASVFGFITIFFGGGQVAGPALAGWLAQTTGNFNAAFWMCAGLTSIAAVSSTYLLKRY